MAVRTVDVVYEFVGLHDTQNAVRPVCLLADFRGDLSETRVGCRSYDDNGPATYPRWQVRQITIPTWLSIDEWARHDRAYCGMMPRDLELPEQLVRLLVTLDLPRRRALRQLMTACLRSEYKISLRAQVQRWLDTPATERQYDSPLSPRQWWSLTRYIR